MSTSYRCVIIDDEPLATRLLTSHVEKIEQLELVGAYNDPVSALNFLGRNTVDLIFLDIQMPTLTGLELAATLDKNTAIILTTAYREYAVESYELAVLDYLLKPITFPRFYKSVNRFIESKDASIPPRQNMIQAEDQEEIFRFFNVNKKHVKIKLADITHVESLKDYVRIFTSQGNFVTKESITELGASLPTNFLRVHRSFLVNTKQITAFTAHDLEINGTEVPIGATYKQKVQEWLAGMQNKDQR